ncbi:MAG: NF038129 family PEP-CTERM protein, partial [Actinomycetia bacterium]|nr:NF038129 family PEP-CTERM protein [Actinomycetes bacterium]
MSNAEALIQVNQPTDANGGDTEDDQLTASVLHISLVGGNDTPPVFGVDELPGKANYLTGDDPSRWITNIPTYEGVQYQDVYPGIDMVYRGSDRQLEYDFVVAPSIDPSVIRLRMDGADRMALDPKGNLVLEMSTGELVEPAPVIYQEIDGLRQIIDGGYVLLGDSEVAFWIDSYDTSETLVIDPVLVYSTYLGGISADEARAVAVDADGNAYIVGEAASIDFPVTRNAGQPIARSDDAFVTKLDPSGVPIYSTYLGGGRRDEARGIAVDDAGNAYIVGGTKSEDFPTVAPIQTAPEEVFTSVTYNAFVTKLDPTGSALVYSTYLGGTNVDGAHDVAIDAAGAAYVTGWTFSSDFPVHQAMQPESGSFLAPFYDAFVTKINAAGSALEYSTYLGGLQDDYGHSIDVDALGNAYVTGITRATDFPLANPIQSQLRGTKDAFVTRLDAAGSLSFSTYLGGSGEEGYGYTTAIAVDDAGNAYLTGDTTSDDFPTQNALQSTLHGPSDAFLTKINSAGTIDFSTYLGGDGDDGGRGITIDTAGSNIYVVGRTSSTDFPVVQAVQSLNRGGPFDGFVTSLDNTGAVITYSTYLGGSGWDELNDVVVDAAGNAIVVGGTDSQDLRTINAAQPFLATQCQSAFGCAQFFIPDALIAKIASQGSATPIVLTESIAAIEGTPFNQHVATFTDTDSDVPGDYLATIDWGDGQTSTGTIEGDGLGTFRVFGAHTYSRHGSYPLLVTIRDRNGTLATPASTAAAANVTAGFVDYQLKIDTSQLSGTSGFLSLQFNPAVSIGTQPADMSLTNFATIGGAVQGSPIVEGATSGSLLGDVQMSNSSGLNRLTQAFDFGTELSFDLRLMGDMIADPSFGSLGTRFSLQLFAADGVTPQLTTHTAGAVLIVDIDPDGGTYATMFSSGATL